MKLKTLKSKYAAGGFLALLVIIGAGYEALTRSQSASIKAADNAELAKRFEQDGIKLAVNFHACHLDMRAVSMAEDRDLEQRMIDDQRDTVHKCKSDLDSQITRMGQYLEEGLGSERVAAQAWKSGMLKLIETAERYPDNPDFKRDLDGVKSVNEVIEHALREKAALDG